jgi:ABC-type Mn2+/Zn2+ transport system permease subunit
MRTIDDEVAWGRILAVTSGSLLRGAITAVIGAYLLGRRWAFFTD